MTQTADIELCMDLAICSGVIPLVPGFGVPVPDLDNRSGMEVPDHVMAMVGA